MEKHPWLEFKNWAVVGASEDKEKYGYKVFKILSMHGYHVIPVTPSYDFVSNIEAKKSLLDIEAPIDVVNLIVNPKIGLGVLDQCAQKGITRVWCQPGAESQDIRDKAGQLGIEIVEHWVIKALTE